MPEGEGARPERVGVGGVLQSGGAAVRALEAHAVHVEGGEARRRVVGSGEVMPLAVA